MWDDVETRSRGVANAARAVGGAVGSAVSGAVGLVAGGGSGLLVALGLGGLGIAFVGYFAMLWGGPGAHLSGMAAPGSWPVSGPGGAGGYHPDWPVHSSGAPGPMTLSQYGLVPSSSHASAYNHHSSYSSQAVHPYAGTYG
ncbi:unnamed protein product [Polarella glacialis]|uniref:Uncharacterized protein n=2 Tax=Polarella glacialis TaxID=89957 RepID=A0A813F872_POLGL|nr:unnamed protein product [Polarella glacialis]